MQHTHQITYHRYADPAELAPPDQDLLQQAVAALPNSYAPYSRFRVAAAARLANGEIIVACNTENAAYPMCLCAERAVLAAAAAHHPQIPVETLAITVKNERQVIHAPASPCGSCRQILTEHEQRYNTKIRLLLRGETGDVLEFESVASILPFGFGPDML